MVNKKIFAIGLGAGAFLTFLVILTVYITYTPPVPYTLPSLADNSKGLVISVYDFALPDEVQRFLAPRPRYFRNAGTVWSREESEEFWIDQIGRAHV